MNGSFSQNLKELRQELKLTQSQLAEKLHYTQSNISEWENGTVEPKATAIISIAHFFNVSTEYLLGLEDETGGRPASPSALLTGNTEIEGGFSETEKRIIEEYRKLPESSKKLLLRMVGLSDSR